MKSIKEQLASEIHIKYLSNAKTAIINGDEMTVLPYGYLGEAVEEAIDRALDYVEKDLNKEIIVKDISGKWNEAVLDFTKDIAERVLSQVKQIIKLKK